jgi:hypothetical protein
MRDTSQTLPAELLIQQFLEWVAARPRCYADVTDAWRTSCPRLPVGECAVMLTAAGRNALGTDTPVREASG